jgi:DNA processing protein
MPIDPPGNDDLAYWLALSRAPGLGGGRLRALLKQFSGPRAVFEERPSALRALGLSESLIRYFKAPPWALVAADHAWLAKPHNHVLPLIHDSYPLQLREVVDAPATLYVRGDVDLLNAPQLAIVGSRRPTAMGKDIAYGFGKALAGHGFVVTSGMAMGIDAAGHRGALAGCGKTIAVMGNGLDRIYPHRNQDLALEISQCGALVSEFPPATPPLAAHFPRRNRIISGLSLGVLVVEAGQRSGSLITAHLAAEQGREVFAVPGSILNPLARGCHRLIREGATLVQQVDDILDEIRGVVGSCPQGHGTVVESSAEQDVGQDGPASEFLEMIGYEPTSVDQLVARSGLTAEAVSSMLLQLELRGDVSLASGGLYSRTGKRK